MENEKNSYGILISTGLVDNEVKNAITIITIDNSRCLEQYYKHIGCRIIDIVYVPAENSCLNCDLDVIVDDEGLLADMPVINPMASFLCQRNIYGNVILMKYNEAEMDTAGFKICDLQHCWPDLCSASSIMSNIIGFKFDIDEDACNKLLLTNVEVKP